MKWLPVSLSERTPAGSLFTMTTHLTRRYHKPRSDMIFCNPILHARRLSNRMHREGITSAELARRLGVSRARITQWLALLELPEQVLREAEALGDHWDRQLVTESGMRRSRRDQYMGLQLNDPDR